MRVVHLLIGLLLLGIVASIGAAIGDRTSLAGARKRYEPTSLRADYELTSQVSWQNNAMGLKLFQEMHRSDPNRNLLISPTSIAMAFSMLLNGTTGTSEQEIRLFLGAHDLTPEEWNLAQSTLANPSTATLSVANALWHMKGIPLREEFNRVSQEYYRAEVAGVPFGKPQAARQINRWISKSTRGLIPAILQETSPEDVLILVNALYLKAEWAAPFQPNATSHQPFKLLNGVTVEVPMLSQSGWYDYYEDEQVQAIRLPFSEGGMGVLAILPPQHIHFADWIASLSTDDLHAIKQNMTGRPGHVRIPKLDFGTSDSLIDPIRALGMKAPFDLSHDFATLLETPEELLISEVRHSTRLKLNEQGVEAAAVTVITMNTGSSGPPPDRFSLIFDRPFLLLIEDEYGGYLFMAAVSDPSAE